MADEVPDTSGGPVADGPVDRRRLPGCQPSGFLDHASGAPLHPAAGRRCSPPRRTAGPTRRAGTPRAVAPDCCSTRHARPSPGYWGPDPTRSLPAERYGRGAAGDRGGVAGSAPGGRHVRDQRGRAFLACCMPGRRTRRPAGADRARRRGSARPDRPARRSARPLPVPALRSPACNRSITRWAPGSRWRKSPRPAGPPACLCTWTQRRASAGNPSTSAPGVRPDQRQRPQVGRARRHRACSWCARGVRYRRPRSARPAPRASCSRSRQQPRSWPEPASKPRRRPGAPGTSSACALRLPGLVPDLQVHGDPDPAGRAPHILSVSCLYVDGESLLGELDRAGWP